MIQALDQLRAHMPGPLAGGVYLVMSEDSLLRDQGVAALQRAAGLDDLDDFNVDQLDAKDGLRSGLELARSYPMMAPQRWVHIREIEVLKEKDAAALMAYLDDPLDATILVLSAGKLDKRTRLYKSLKSKAVVADLAVPTQRDLPRWIHDRTREHRLSMDMQAKQLLAEAIGPNLQLIERALEQLRNYVHPSDRVSPQHVENLICRSRTASVFDLTDAIGAKKISLAMKTLRTMEADGEQPLMILAMIARHFRQLLRAKCALAARVPERGLGKQLGVPPFVARKLAEQSRQYSTPSLMRAFPMLLELDILLKSSSIGYYVLLQDLVVNLMEVERR
jgi:DNA polymerase III subunit delta